MKRKLLIVTAIVLLLPLLGLGWLASTEAGLRWAYRTASPWLPGEFRAAEISGRLAGPLRFTAPAWKQQQLSVEAAKIEVDWNPWALFALQLEVTRLHATTLKIELAADDGAGKPPSSSNLPRIVLPLALQLDQAFVDGIELRRGASAYRLTGIELQGEASYNRFEIARLAIESSDFRLSVDGKITARDNYPLDLGFDWQASLPTGESLTGSGRIAGDLAMTRLDQRVKGRLTFDHWLELREPLAGLQWKSGIVAENFDSRVLDPELPPVEGRLQATAEGNLESASATGKLAASAPRIGDFVADFRLHNLDGERRFDGLQVDSLTLSTLGGEIRSQGLVEWLPLPRWNLEVSAASIDPAALFADWPGQLNADFDTTGSFDKPKLRAQVRIARLEGRLRGYPVSARGRLDWDDGAVGIDGLEVASGDTRIAASGTAAQALDLKWRLASGDLGELYPGVSGRLEAEGGIGGRRDAPRIDAKFDGQAIGYDEYRLGRANGRVSLNPLQLDRYDIRIEARDLRLRGQQLRSLDLTADSRRIEAKLAVDEASARLALEGSFDAYRWHGKLVEALLQSRDHGDWKLVEPAPLELSPQRVAASDVCLQNARRSRLCGSVDQQADRWNFALQVARLPLDMLARWAPPDLEADGLADARARLEYLPADNRLQGEALIELGSGRAKIPLAADRLLPVDYAAASLELRLRPAAVDADATLDLANGDRLQASARLRDSNLLDANLAERPLQATLRGQLTDLAFAGVLSPRLESLAGTLGLDLKLSGSLRAPDIGGEARLSDARLRIAPTQLQLDDLQLVIRGDAQGKLSYRASAALGDGKLEFDGGTRLDADAGWPSEMRIAGNGIAAADLLYARLPVGVTIDGLFDVDAELQYSAPAQLHGKLGLVSAQGQLRYPLLENEIEHWEYRDARFDFVLEDDGIHGETRVTVGDDNRLQASLDLPQARLLALDPRTQPLAASAQVEFRQIDIVELLVPDIDKPRGRLKLDADASGTLASPRFTARAELAEAAVEIPRLGLQIAPIRMTGSSDADGRFQFVVDARSGDGTLNIKGSSLLDAARGWPTRIEINGQNFVAARIPEASVDLSPALLVEIQGRSIDISGDLRVPFARVQPRDISTAQRVSSDTVVIGGDQPADPGWRISTRINLILEDRVAFYGYGFEGRLTGKLRIEQQPGQPTSGTGEIAIPSGRYRAYGQRLDIENGRVLFTGGPVTNPGLDIRATRTSGTIVTGLLVRGRLRNPQIELFSTPAMGQTDTLSYLLFGRPLEDASGEDSALMAQAALTLGLAGGDQLARSLRERFGLDEFRVETADSGDQASLVVGRYLSPDFYVSYAVGLIESVNSLNLRYQINDHWQLEAESGIHQGADLLYTIER